MIAFCPFLINKMRVNLIKKRSCAIFFGGLTALTGFLVIFRLMNVSVFLLVDEKLRKGLFMLLKE